MEGLLQDGERLWNAGVYAQALRVLDAALARAVEGGEPRLEARALNLLADVAHSQGEWTIGLERHQRALGLARSVGDEALEARVLADMGLGHWRRAEYVEADARCRESLALREHGGDTAGQGEAHGCLGRIFFKQGRHDEAVAEYLRALTLARTAGDVHGQAISLEDLANAYRDRQAFTEALAYFERSLALMEQAGDTAGRCRVLGLLGHLHLVQGADGEALRYFRRALQVAKDASDPAGTSSGLSKLAGVYARRGQGERALAYYAASLRIRRDIADPREQGWTLARMAGVFARQGRLEEALRHYEEAIRIWEQVRDARAPVWYLLEVGRVHERLHDDGRALESYERALRLGEQIQLPMASLALGHLGRLHARQGRADEGLAYGLRAVAVADASANPELAWKARYDLARIRLALGQGTEALNGLHETLDIVEALRAGVVPSDEARAGWLEDRREVYATTVAALMQGGRPGEALVVAERGRGQAFLDLVASRVAVQPPDLGRLSEEARRRGSTLVEYFAAGEHTFIWVLEPSGEVHAVASPAGPEEVARLVDELRRRLPADSAARDQEIEERADDGEALGAAGVAPPPASAPVGAHADPRPVLRRLHAALIEPVAEWLPRDPRQLVTFVPHGRLFLLSFSALLDGQGRYLVERHTINYTPAIAVMQYTGRHAESRTGPGRVMVVGNPTMPTLPERHAPLRPLPGAEREARAIGRLFPARHVTLLLGARAAEWRVRELAPRYTILHLATHGVVRDDAPMESLLALAPSGVRGRSHEVARAPEARAPGFTSGASRPEIARRRAADRDGLWTAREVLDLDLPADLVTLSACNTGLGRVTGDGVFGLSRAFLHAGTASLVVSLWRVADSVTRHQMERFYRELGNGTKDRAAALRRAQLDTIRSLRQGRLRTASGRALAEDPALWAPFVLIGEPR